jgi:hypothetical protein
MDGKKQRHDVRVHDGSKLVTGSHPRFLKRCLLVPWLEATITRV